jgi:AcrR family transcriptional regulator
MRRVAEELGSEAMSLYYHVANKEDLLDGTVDVVVREINAEVGRLPLPAEATEWKISTRERILLARDVLLRHPWAPRLFESRTQTSQAILEYHDRLIGIMRFGGFSNDLIHHALHALGSRALGFSQELFDPSDGSTSNQPIPTLEAMAEHYPHLTAMLSEVVHDDPDTTIGWCDDQTEFEFGLDLILDGLERLKRS